MDVTNFLNSSEKDEIKKAIALAEKNTSGEIRLRIENKCDSEAIDRAIKVFDLLKMYKTKDRNGVLVYISIEDKKLAIIGDQGINNVVPEGFWQSTVDTLKSEFAKGEFAKGIQGAVLDIGLRLKAFFPFEKDDKNELSDDISTEHLQE